MAFKVPFKGNTSGSITTTLLNIPCVVKSITLVNKSGSTATVNVYISSNEDGSAVSIVPYNMQLATGNSYERDTDIQVLAGYSILITTNQSLDYYFSIFGTDGA
jgi:hypothetical protein